MNRRSLSTVLGIVALSISPLFAHELSTATSNAPSSELTQNIDAYFADYWAKSNVSVSPVCSDREIVRRAYLDLVGRIPTLQETEAFLADSREQKRQLLFDSLLSSSEFGEHFSNVFTVVLLGPTPKQSRRNRSVNREAHGWREYLAESFNSGRPWNQMARDMTLARHTPGTDVRGGWYLYERRNDHQAIAESIAPNFFGIQIQCAQCHDHPLADEIKQAHYWGLVAFFKRGKNENTKAGPRVVESAIGGFDKFSDLVGDSFDTELTFFDSPIVEEARPDGEQTDSEEFYTSVAKSNEPRVPKFSRRERFVDVILKNDRMIARAFVNKLWALLIGRGFVHPVDQMDSQHPASHPKLLDRLTDAFIESNFNIKELAAAIVRSQCYQLHSVPSDNSLTPDSFAYGLEKPLIAESYLRSMSIAIHGRDAEVNKELLNDFRQRFSQVFPEVITSDLKDSLYLTNNREFLDYISSVNDGTIANLLESQSSDRVDMLFKIVFGRPPDNDELAAARRFLDNKSDPADALTQLLWAMLTSAEFRFNH